MFRIVGPNTLAVLVPVIGLDASFAHLKPVAGGIAFVAESGAISTSVLDWAVVRDMGFSHIVTLGDGRAFVLRPIRPADEPALIRGFERLDEEEIRQRFFVPMKTLLHVTAARCTQIDYDPELAFVLADPGAPGIAEIWGEVLADNAATLALARSLGFEEQKTTDHVVRMVRKP